MRICGFAAEGLRNERRIHDTFPVKELQDYWSSRPRYEDVNPKSKEFRSGSLLSDKADDVGEDPEGEGQTYQEWLALQREGEKEEVPPPPYTLEGDESIPPQTVTNVDVRSSTVAMTAEVPVRNLPAVANVQPPVSSSHAAARPAISTNTYPTSHAASSSHVLSSSIPATSPPAVNINTYPTSVAPASQQETYSQVSAQSPHPSYPPAQGHSPGSVHHPQSVPPSQGHSPQPYPPGVPQHLQSYPPSHSSSQPYPAASGQQLVQSYPPNTGPPQHHQPYQVQNFQPYPPTSGQAPVWGQQSQPYPYAGGGPSYQGYPTSTEHFQGYPATGAPSQGGYTSPIAQSYPTSGGPVRQGYPPVDIQGHPSNNNNTCQIHNPSQDSVAALANEFGRQSITSPSGVSSSGGQLPTPPPLHPTHPNRLSPSPLKPSSPSSGGRLPSPPPLHPAHPNRPTRLSSSSLKPSSPTNLPNRPHSSHSQTGHHHHAATSSAVSSSSSGQVTSKPNTSTSRPRWPPAEWESDTPPIQQQQFSGRRPSASQGHIGATLTRPQTVGASSSNLTEGSRLRPTLSMNARPSRPDTNMPSASAAYPFASAEPTAQMHGRSDNHANPFSFPAYDQYVTFPPGPQYNSSYMPSGYPDQQGGIHGSWTGSGRVSPPPTFPDSSMAYGVPEPQYPGGPTFPSASPSGPAAGGERLHFPEGPGGSYYDASSSYPATWNSTSGPPMQSRK